MKKKRNKPGAGRPTKDSATRRRIIIDALRNKLPFRYACQLAKIDPDTCRNWIRRDIDFSLEIDEAKAYGIQDLVNRVTDKDPWKILKNIGKEEFKEHINLVVDESDPIDIELPDGETDTI